MNFLAHLALSGDDPEIMVGNLMGDFVKGRLEGMFDPHIRQGLELHRRIDRFAEGNPNFVSSRQRLDASFGLFRGALVDLFYDHFLARNWHRYYGKPLLVFIDDCFVTVSRFRETLPDRLAQRLPELFGDWLPSYREVEGIAVVLKRMSLRFRRQNPLAEGADQLQRHYRELEDDFFRFYPELQAFVAREISPSPPGTILAL